MDNYQIKRQTIIRNSTPVLVDKQEQLEALASEMRSSAEKHVRSLPVAMASSSASEAIEKAMPRVDAILGSGMVRIVIYAGVYYQIVMTMDQSEDSLLWNVSISDRGQDGSVVSLASDEAIGALVPTLIGPDYTEIKYEGVFDNIRQFIAPA